MDKDLNGNVTKEYLWKENMHIIRQWTLLVTTYLGEQ